MNDILAYAQNFKGLLTFLLSLILAFLLSKIVKYVLSKWGKKITSKTQTELDDRLLDISIQPLGFLIILGGFALGLGELGLPEKIFLIAYGIVFVLSVLVGALLLYRIGDTLLYFYMQRVSQKTDRALQKDFIPLIQKVFAIFIFLSVLIVILRHFHYDILSLVAALGVGSLAVGLAAKDTLANMISGFTIMVDRPVRAGDRVVLSSGETGDVLDIGLRSTKIRMFDHTILIMPNSDLVNSRIMNHCYPDPRVKVRIKIGVGYGSDVDKVKKVLIEEALKIPECLKGKDEEPAAYFLEFADSALIFLVTFWVGTWKERFEATDKMNMAIKKRFEKEGIEIPFPIRTVYLKSPSPQSSPIKGEEG